MAHEGEIRARLQLRGGAGADAPSALWAGELRALLEGVQELCSLSAAATRLDMEYRQAWRVIRRAELLFSTTLTEKRVGGAGGGGSRLTTDGRELLRRLNAVLDGLSRHTSSAFRTPLGAQGRATGDVIVLASSTEPVDSGLLDRLESAFLEDTGLTVRHIAAGSGQAHELAEWGRADAVLSHAPGMEKRFMDRGIGVRCIPIMKNRFVLLGPHSDPAGLKQLEGTATLSEMFARIAERRAPFVSRNDASGTNLRELELWEALGINSEGEWYHAPPEAGGSSAAVRCAVRRSAYTLVDSATASRHIELRRFVPRTDGGAENVFSVLVVDARSVPGTNTEGALRLAEWLGSDRGRRLIASFGAPAPLYEPYE